MPNLSTLSRGTQLLVGAGVLLLIDMFLEWQSVDVGPFSAGLILVRGANHPDVFPAAEPRLHRAMRAAYDRPDASEAELARIAEAWRPYRSWVSVLFRSAAGGAPELLGPP